MTRVGNSLNWVNYTYMTECRMCCFYGFAVLSFMMENFAENFFKCGKFFFSFFLSLTLSFSSFRGTVFLIQPTIMWEFSFDLTCYAVSESFWSQTWMWVGLVEFVKQRGFYEVRYCWAEMFSILWSMFRLIESRWKDYQSNFLNHKLSAVLFWMFSKFSISPGWQPRDH
jgi:hypothetical protein